MQPAAARDTALLRRAAAAARRLLDTSTEQPRVAAACMLLVGCTAAVAEGEADLVEQGTEAIGGALSGGQLGHPQPVAAADAMAAVAALLPVLQVRRLGCGACSMAV